MANETINLSTDSKTLIDKFNICLDRYDYYIKDIEHEAFDFGNQTEYKRLIDILKNKINSEEENIKILEFALDKLEAFSDTYNVNVKIIDDFKLVYFIALYFLWEDEDFNDETILENNLILIVLHKVMCTTLLAYEPMPILNKLEEFIKKNPYKRFKDEYGDIGYYHMVKSIYLMQELNVKAFISEDDLQKDDFILSYFKDS